MKYNWSKEHLQNTVNKANCWFNWLDILGIPRGGYNYYTLKKKAELYSIDTSHFDFVYAKTHNGRTTLRNMTDKKVFSISHNRNILKREYIIRILNNHPHCELCGIEDWCGKPLSFQLHHIDGNNKNNSVNNLQLLCPNCHSQTNTYSNKKR